MRSYAEKPFPGIFVQRSTFDVRRSAFGSSSSRDRMPENRSPASLFSVRRSAFDVRLRLHPAIICRETVPRHLCSAFDVRRSTFDVRLIFIPRSYAGNPFPGILFSVRRSTFDVRRSTFGFVTTRSPDKPTPSDSSFITHHSSLITHHSPFDSHSRHSLDKPLLEREIQDHDGRGGEDARGHEQVGHRFFLLEEGGKPHLQHAHL